MIWITDSEGCVSDTTLNVKLGEPGRIQIHNNIDHLSCFMSEDGVMSISVFSGTPPYDYTVEFNNITHILIFLINEIFFKTFKV